MPDSKRKNFKLGHYLPILLLMMQSAAHPIYRNCYDPQVTCPFMPSKAKAKTAAHHHKPTGCYAGKYGWTYDHNEGGWPDRKSCEGYRKNPVGLTGDPNPSEREKTVISNPCNPKVEPIYTTYISECMPNRDGPNHGTWREIPDPSEGVEINKEYTQSDIYLDGHHYLATCPYSHYPPEEGCGLKLIPDNPINTVPEKRIADLERSAVMNSAVEDIVSRVNQELLHRISDLEKRVQELEFRSDADSLVCDNCISSPSTDPELQHKPNAAGRITYGGAEEFTVYRGMCGDQECVELYRSGNPGILQAPSISLITSNCGGDHSIPHPCSAEDLKELKKVPRESPNAVSVAPKICGTSGREQCVAGGIPKTYSCTSPEGVELICGEGCRECKEVVIPFPDGSVLTKK